jgi:hypothetical protein
MSCKAELIRIDAFAKLFDGFSIGSNDLTQLTPGVDRDTDVAAFEFDVRDPGVTQSSTFPKKGPIATTNMRESAAKRRPIIRTWRGCSSTGALIQSA